MKTEWISVKERLPDHNNPVMVYKDHTDKKKYQFRYDRIKIDRYVPLDANELLSGCWTRVDNVSHWSELPFPPQE